MNIAVYADESYDGSGGWTGSNQSVIGGIIGLREDWAKFCTDWRSVLDRYGVDYFHFREWSNASQVVRGRREASSDFNKNPYREWSQERLDDFLLTLAGIVAAGDKIVIGPTIKAKKFHNAKIRGELRLDANILEYHLHHFFINVVGCLMFQKSPWKNLPVSFFFDQGGEWQHCVMDMFRLYKQKHRTFADLAFSDKHKNPPPQAADMVAYRTRQIMENFSAGRNPRTWEKLDSILFGSKEPVGPSTLRKSKQVMAYIRKELDDVLPIRIQQ